MKATRVDLEHQEQTACEMFQTVIKSHPRTPWASRAEFELSQGFGMHFYEAFHDPRHRAGLNIKVPNP